MYVYTVQWRYYLNPMTLLVNSCRGSFDRVNQTAIKIVGIILHV